MLNNDHLYANNPFVQLKDQIFKNRRPVKILTEEEKVRLCQIVTETKADYIKTSTGFGSAGATVEDVILFRKECGPDVKIKAAGGIRTMEDAENMLSAGADRLGSSALLAR